MTGATGYIGSRLVLSLVRDGHAVTVVCRKSSDTALLEPVLGDISFLEYDGSFESIFSGFSGNGFDMVFHLASLFIVNHASGDVGRLIDSNLLFSSQLAEACARSGCRYFVNTGTSWQYFNNEPGHPANLYAATKEAFESILRYYCSAFDMRSVTVTLFDTYGPADPRKKIVQLLLCHSVSGVPINMSPGMQLIDLVYIDDVISAFRTAGDLIESGTIDSNLRYAVSSCRPVTLKDLVEKCRNAFGGSLTVNFGATAYREREVMIPWTDGTLLPGWSPSVTLEDGLVRTFKAFV